MFLCILIVGGIGIIVFFLLIKEWESKGWFWYFYYVVYCLKDVVFLDIFFKGKIIVYLFEESNRFVVEFVILKLGVEGSLKV